jgi:hypothetical protein
MAAPLVHQRAACMSYSISDGWPGIERVGHSSEAPTHDVDMGTEVLESVSTEMSQIGSGGLDAAVGTLDVGDAELVDVAVEGDRRFLVACHAMGGAKKSRLGFSDREDRQRQLSGRRKWGERSER